MKPEEGLIQLRAENQAMREQLGQRDELIDQLIQRIDVLEKRLAKDNHNSSLPPSSDHFARQKKSRSLRKRSGKKAGGQDEHPGSTLQMSQTPDEVITLSKVARCQHSQADLVAIAAQRLERRQVIDVSLPRLQVTEYQQAKSCLSPPCVNRTLHIFSALQATLCGQPLLPSF